MTRSRSSRTWANSPAQRTIELANGGLALTQASAPSSVYVAYPGVGVQIEVFDPDPAAVLKLDGAGAVTPVG